MANTPENLSNTAFRQGMSIGGPIFSAYVHWVLDKSTKLGLDALLFLARDGQLLQKIAREYSPDIPIHYVGASRASWYPCSPRALGPVMLTSRIRDEYRTLERTSNAFKIPVAKFPKIDVEPDERLTKTDIETLVVFLTSKGGERITRESNSTQTQLLLEYLNSFKGIDSNANIGIVDIGWEGSLQRILQQIWNDAGYNGKIHGFYFGINHHRNPVNFHGFAYEHPRIPHWAENYPTVIEMLTPSNHGSVIGFEDSNGSIRPVHANNPIIEPTVATSYQNGALEWVRSNAPLKRKDAVDLLKRTIEIPSFETARFFANFKFESSLFPEKGKNPIPIFSLQKSLLYLLKPTRNQTDWPWPQATLKLSGTLPPIALKIKFYISLIFKNAFCRIERLAWMLFEQPDFVSLDVFDTVLFRNVEKPIDIFKTLEVKHGVTGFAQMRQEAEIQERQAHPSGEVTLDAIYQRLQNDHSDLPWQAIKQSELSAENLALSTTPKIKLWVEKLREKHGRLVFISDMYIPSSWIAEKLIQEGIMTAKDKLWVSCEHEASKHNRCLYKIIRDTYKPKTWIHYGDNIVSDVFSAAREGIRPYWRPNKASYHQLTRFIKRRIKKAFSLSPKTSL